MVRRRMVMAVLAILVALPLSGCKDPYGACAKAGADIATSITQGMGTVNGLYQQGLMTQKETADVLDYLEFANKADEAFLSCVGSAHSTNAIGAFTACATGFNATLNTPQQLALLHVQNAKASGEVTTIVNGVTTAVQAVVTGLGGK